MSTDAKPGWISTTVKSLYRHTNGRYYARVSLGGKKMWKSLETKLKSVAEQRLNEHVSSTRGRQPVQVEESDGKMTFGKALELYQLNFERDAEIAEGTKEFRRSGVKLVLKTWPVTRITECGTGLPMI
jgi:hypothetical protein